MKNRKLKPWKELTIKDDYMFKLIMLNKLFCIHMLEMILGFKIKDITYIENEKTLKHGYCSKGVRLDVYAENDDAVFDVELQVGRQNADDLAKRMRYYQSAIDQYTLKAGYKYSRLKPSYIIFICPFDPFGHSRHIYTFHSRCDEATALQLGDDATKIVLSTKGTLDDASPELKAFLDYIDGIISNDAFVQKLDGAIKQVKENEMNEVNYKMWYEDIYEEIREEIGEEFREKGRAEGRKEGREENRIGAIRSLMKNAGLTLTKAMALLDIPTDEQPKYAALV